MLLYGKPLHEVNEDILVAMQNSQEIEHKSLEFKERLHVSSDEEKKEFLADVCSFANASGGFIIYGVQAKEGAVVSLPGLTGDPDAARNRIESSIRDGIRPRIAGIDSSFVKLSNDNWVLVLCIPKSLAAPHMVTYKGTSRFYARHSGGKYQLDVDEIRAAFALSEDLSTRLRNLRVDRLAKIKAGETPVPLLDEPKIVMQIVPVSNFQSSSVLNIQSLRTSKQWRELSFSGASSERFNIDGLLRYQLAGNPEHPGSSGSYIQLFREGSLEAVDAYMLRLDETQKHYIPYVSMEDAFIPFCFDALRMLRAGGIELPILVFLSLLGVRGYEMPTQGLGWNAKSEVIDREDLLLPEVWLDDWPADVTQMVDDLKPAFDALWNATGFAGWVVYQQCRQRLSQMRA